MKKNKKRILISVVILLITFILVSVIFKNNNDKNEVDIPSTIGIESYEEFANINVTIGKNIYVKGDSTYLNIYNLDNNIITKYESDYLYYNLFNDYIVISNNNFKKVIDKYGNVLASGSTFNKSHDNKYILVDNVLYDSNMNLIYTLDYIGNLDYNTTFVNDLLIIEPYNGRGLILDIINKKILYDYITSYDLYFSQSDLTYIRFTQDNIGYLMNVKTKEVLYKGITYEYGGYTGYNVFTYEGNTYYIIGDYIYGQDTLIDNKYIMDKDSCKVGYKLKDLNNNIVIDKCFSGYKILFEGSILGVNIEDDDVLYTKEKEIKGASFTLQGDYIKVTETSNLLGDETKNTYFNKDLEKKEFDEYISLYYIGNGYYYGYDIYDYKYYFYDKYLNKISDSFTSIFCNANTYCDVSNNHIHYLYKDGQKVLNEKFKKIEIDDNSILVETLYKTYILKLSYNKNIPIDLSIDYNIDINEFISKYSLEEDKTIIENNEELFKKYAYIVENNDFLKDRKKELYDLFKVVIDKKKYLDEFYFLSKLGKLNILYKDSLLDGKAAGTYEDYGIRVSLASNLDNVVYHEFIHFLDYSINYNLDTVIYKCDGKYQLMLASEFGEDACEYVDIGYSNYITEAGAEAFSVKYFTKDINSYSFATYYFMGLEYVYGSDEIDKWFFDDDNYFYLRLLNDFEDVDTVNKIIKTLNKTTSLTSESFNTGYLLDVLIDLYKKHIGDDYLSDKKFLLILKTMQHSDNIDTSKYYNEFKAAFDTDYMSLIDLKSVVDNKKCSLRIDQIVTIIIDDKMYLSLAVWHESEASFVWIDYDFAKDKVIDYYFYKDKVFEYYF